MRKRTKLALIAVFVAVVLVPVLWRKGTPPQIITLPKGEMYEFAGVTWGREAVPPTLDAQVVHRLPAALGNWLRNRFPKRLSQVDLGQKYPEPCLFTWYRYVGTNRSYGKSGYPMAILADEAGVKGGSSSYPNFARSVAWSYVSFPAIPRRSRALQCQFYSISPESGNAVGGMRGDGLASTQAATTLLGLLDLPRLRQEAYFPFSTIRFPNPLYGHFPQWKAEPLPIVKASGDLEVRLDAVTSGHPNDETTFLKPNGGRAPYYSPIQTGESIGTGLEFSVRPPKGTNETWVAHRFEISDATGNVLGAKSYNFLPAKWSDQQFSDWKGYCENVQGTLWPDEAAWRVRLEMKRASGFSSEDLVTFKKVPVAAVGTTNAVPITNIVGGMQIVLLPITLRTYISPSWANMGGYGTYFHVVLPDKSSGVSVDLLDMTTDAGVVVGYGNSSTGSKDHWYFHQVVPTNATTADITLVVQKTRAVDFFVKPPKFEPAVPDDRR